MTTSPSYFVALAFINLQSSLPFILMPFLFTHHESIKAGGALQFKVFSLIIDRLSPNHWTFHFFSIIFLVKSSHFPQFKAYSSKLLLQPYFHLKFSFIQSQKPIFSFLMAFILVMVDSLIKLLQYLIVTIFLSIFFFRLQCIFMHAFLTLLATCSFLFIVF